MAISQQFSDIVKNHPELLKQGQGSAAATTVQTPVKSNPFNRFKQNGAAPVKPASTVVPTAGSPFGKPNVVEPPKTVVNEDSDEDDPALVAVADKPYESKVNKDVVVKKAEEKPAVEEKVEEQKESDKKEIAQQSEEQLKEKPASEPAVKEQKTSATTARARKKLQTAKAEEEQKSENLNDFMGEEEKDPDYFKNAIESYKGRYLHEEFQKYQDDILKRLEEIEITPDLNTGTVKVRLAEIAALRMEILKHRIDIKMLSVCPLDKEHGDVYAAGKLHAKGNNETERKSAYFQYLKNFPVKDGTVDVIFLTTVLEMYNVFFEAVLAELKVKQDILITYTGNLKVDAMIS